MPQAPITQPILPATTAVNPTANKVAGSEPVKAEGDFADTLKQAEADQTRVNTEVKEKAESPSEAGNTTDSAADDAEVTGQNLPQMETELPPDGVILPVTLSLVSEVTATHTQQTDMFVVRPVISEPAQALPVNYTAVIGDSGEPTNRLNLSQPIEVMGLTLPIMTAAVDPALTGVITPIAAPVTVPVATIGNQIKSTAPATVGELDVALETEGEQDLDLKAPLNSKSTTTPMASAGTGNLTPAVSAQGALVNQSAQGVVSAEAQPIVNVEGQLDSEDAETFSQRLTTEQAKLMQRPESAQPIKNTAGLQAPLGFNQPGWEQRIGERINVMIGQQIQNARILLDPPELGALEIKIQVQNDQTNVSFVASTTQGKDVLDSQIHRLREMFEAQGMNLDDVDVSQQNQQQEQQPEELAEGYQEGNLEGDEIAVDEIEMAPVGLVNYYA